MKQEKICKTKVESRELQDVIGQEIISRKKD